MFYQLGKIEITGWLRKDPWVRYFGKIFENVKALNRLTKWYRKGLEFFFRNFLELKLWSTDCESSYCALLDLVLYTLPLILENYDFWNSEKSSNAQDSMFCFYQIRDFRPLFQRRFWAQNRPVHYHIVCLGEALVTKPLSSIWSCYLTERQLQN